MDERFKPGVRVRVKCSGERGRISRLSGDVVIVEFPKLHADGRFSMSELARRFSCSRWSIGSVLGITSQLKSTAKKNAKCRRATAEKRLAVVEVARRKEAAKEP